MIWKILGIDPTSDMTKIRKAYAQKVRIIDARKDPEAFQALKQAFDSAIHEAKTDNVIEETAFISNQKEPDELVAEELSPEPDSFIQKDGDLDKEWLLLDDHQEKLLENSPVEEGYDWEIPELDENTVDYDGLNRFVDNKIKKKNKRVAYTFRFAMFLFFLMFLAAKLSVLFVHYSGDLGEGKSKTQQQLQKDIHEVIQKDMIKLDPAKMVFKAELSLNTNDISAASESIKKFGGDQKQVLLNQLSEVKEQANQEKQKLQQENDSNKLVADSKGDSFKRLSYYLFNGQSGGSFPSFTQYTEEDIIEKWGKPDEIIIQNGDIINKNLGFNYVEGSSFPINQETQLILTQYQSQKMTWRERKAAELMLNDAKYYKYSKVLMYSKQGKPNVYFSEKHKINYISPIMSYLQISRVPASFEPYKGLGNYPDDFPKDYPQKE